MLEQFLKNCNPVEGLTLEKFVKDCILWEGPHPGAGEEREKEGASETKHYKLIATLIPHPPEPLVEELEELGVKLSLGSRERCGKGVFRFVLTSHYPIAITWQ